MAISEYEQEFKAPVAVSFVCKKWFQMYNPSNIHSVDDLFESLVLSHSFHSFNIINARKHVNNAKQQ